MDKKAIKKFAISSRNTLIKSVKNKAAMIGITEAGIEEANIIDKSLVEIKSTNNRLEGNDIQKRERLVAELESRAKLNDYTLAYETLIEEVAYTWFNRVIAIRFMEVNNYLPFRLRVLSSEREGKQEPDIITELMDTELYQEFGESTQNRIVQLLMDNSADAIDELYQLVFIKVCNSLNKQLPDLFETIDDYTELLFTISYIDENGIIASLMEIPEADFDINQQGQVEIIGWMYQYYNTEPKDKVFARGNRKIRSDEIPAATQLFTPDWIVRYMVENSLGRFYIDQKLANPMETRTEKEIADTFGWKYYLPTAEQPEDVQLQIQDDRKDKSVFTLQEIKLLDNAMGSGHVLIYAFDVFMDLYVADGFNKREAAELIMENNLYGIEIDKRAYQLAYFAIMMKGRQYNRRLLGENTRINLFCFVNSDDISNEYYERIEELSSLEGNEFQEAVGDFKVLIDKFRNAKELGSIINLKNTDIKKLESFSDLVNVFESFSDMDVLYGIPAMHEKVLTILEISKILIAKYSAIVTNPPYLNKMSTVLGSYVTKNYKDVKTDLFSVFVKMNSTMLVNDGYAGFMTPFVWMFIKSYEELRTFLISNKSIASLIQMEYSAFEEATVPVCCFTIKNTINEPIGNYFKLSKFKGGMEVQNKKVIEGILNPAVNYFYQTNQKNFEKIPGNPISFWVSENIIKNFDIGIPIGELLDVKRGMTTSNNDCFLRLWYEVEFKKIKISSESRQVAKESKATWFPYSKGGGYRKWYGYNEYVIDWKNDGEKVIDFAKTINKSYTRTIVNIPYYFKPSVGFSYITSGPFSMRWIPEGFVYDSGGPGMFGPIELREKVIGFMNSKPAQTILKILSPTINLQIADIIRVPFLINDSVGTTIRSISKKNIEFSKSDWDSSEISWDFKKNPLL